MTEKRIYFNNPQRLTQLIGANTSVIVAGRRTGKTDSIAAPFALRNMQRMQGSTGGIVVPTFKHGLTNTLPGLLAAWKRWGFLNGVHYVVGRRPPKSFKRPIIEPNDYEHVISFYNGSCAVIISQDRPGSSNSLTLSWLLVDEAKFIDYQKLKDETLPANGGIKSFFGRHSFNHAMMVLSDMPQTQKGSWFLHYKEKMDPELIRTIEGTVFEIWKTKQRVRSLNEKGAEVPPYLKGYLRRLDRSLNQLRSVAVYYKEYSSIENLQRAALYLQQKPFLPALHIKIHPGITVTVLGQHPVESLLPQPLLHHMVGGLAVDVEQHPVCLAHGHQVIGGFSPRCARRREPHLAPRNEQLPAAPGVFHMNALLVPIQLHLGDKAIGPCQKNSFCNIFVDHGGLLWGRQPLGEWF